MLEAEREQDETVLKKRLSSWSVEKLRLEGYCITDLSAFWYNKRRFGRPVAGFTLGPGVTLPAHHLFEQGTQVLVTHLDPLTEAPGRGSVVACSDTSLDIIFPEKFDLEVDKPWRLDVGRSNIAFERMEEAIRQLHSDPASQESPENTIPDQEPILRGTYLRDILLRSFRHKHEPGEDVDAESAPDRSENPLSLEGVFKEDSRIVSWARRYSRPDPVVIEGDPVLEGLNSTQIRAIAMMLNNRFSLVQGPPGTGKTKTIIETVKLLKNHFKVPYPILLCTFTNVAVDNLVEGIVTSSLEPLRIGSSGKIKSGLEDYVLETRLERHPLASELERVKEKLEAVTKRKRDLERQILQLRDRKLSENGTTRLHNMDFDFVTHERQENAYNAKAYALYLEMLRDIVLGVDVICTTSISSASAALNVADFPIVLIDEASMSTEPASLVPLMKGSRHAALIGDHKQLPPVVTSSLAQVGGLGVSLFERLSNENFLPTIMLDVQYRMHPNISRFPSAEFYHMAVRDGTVDALGRVSSHLMPPQSFIFPEMTKSLSSNDHAHRPSVVFLDHIGNESLKDRSRVNWNEARIICSLVEDLLLRNPSMKGSDIGIIAPYVAQISLLTRLLHIDARYRKRFYRVLGGKRLHDLKDIEIKTVDGFEGREKDIIIFSTVRNNSAGHIGFLADRRRLNVGLTRAKRSLFIVGSISTLRHGKISGGDGSSIARVGKGAEAWHRYAEFLNQERLIVNLQGEFLQRLLAGNVSVDHARAARY